LKIDHDDDQESDILINEQVESQTGVYIDSSVHSVKE
jgi:hypothetical protein